MLQLGTKKAEIPRCSQRMEESKNRLYWCIVIAFLFTLGCTTAQSISEEAVQEKLAKIQVGFTTKREIENLFGKAHITENSRWSYSLSDAALEISQIRGPIPITVTSTPTNTRALIGVRFNENETVSGLEIARFFNIPYTNDYSYFLDRITDRTLESAMRAGEMSNFHVAEFDKSAGKFLLVYDGANDARVVVKLEKQILHITSINPYDRVSNEYRVFRRRETQFIERISASTDTDINTHPQP